MSLGFVVFNLLVMLCYVGTFYLNHRSNERSNASNAANMKSNRELFEGIEKNTAMLRAAIHATSVPRVSLALTRGGDA